MAEILPFDAAYWKGAIEDARSVRRTVSAWWDANLEAYAPKPTDSPTGYGQEVNTNRDFTLVERKKADLFYQSPEVAAVPSPLFTGQEGLLDTHTDILNSHLGLNGINLKDTVHRALFDVLCTAGTGWTMMGYEMASIPVTEDVTTGQQPLPGSVLNLGPSAPVTAPQTNEIPVYEHCFWRWFSPKQALVPKELRSTVWDDAPWLGVDLEVPLLFAQRKGWVPVDYKGDSPSPDSHFDFGFGASGTDRIVRMVLIYYYSSLYRLNRPHPQHQTRLLIVESGRGAMRAVVHDDSPFQTLTPKGELSPDSLIGYPIHPLTIRVLTDASVVPSDCTVSRPLVNELNIFREQMIKNRDANLMRYTYNTDVLPTDALEKVIRSPTGGMIGLPGEAFAGESIKELPHGTYPRENFEFNNYLDNDLARTHGLDAAQAGAGSAGGVPSATEAAIRQGNINARLGLERGRVLDWYVQGVTKYSTLLQRFMPIEQAAAIVGVPKAREWDTWRKVIPARLAFEALPDSTAQQDLAADRKRAMDEYTFFANDPFIDRPALLKRLLPRLRYPASLVKQPTPPGPQPARPMFTFKGDDLNPLSPQYPIVMQILQEMGVTISPQATQEAQATAQNALLAEETAAAAPTAMPTGAQPPHGGKVAPMESLSKHANALTGNLPNGPQGVQ